MNSNLVKDIATTLLIILGLVASIFLLNVGIGLLFVIGFIVPGWVFILLLVIILYRRHKKK